MMGFLHATGLVQHHVREAQRDQQRALVYYGFAARNPGQSGQSQGGDGGAVLAQMAMGYRHLAGVAVQSGCEEALNYYGMAADQRTFRILIDLSLLRTVY